MNGLKTKPLVSSSGVITNEMYFLGLIGVTNLPRKHSSLVKCIYWQKDK